jgi:hypothetical protein
MRPLRDKGRSAASAFRISAKTLTTKRPSSRPGARYSSTWRSLSPAWRFYGPRNLDQLTRRPPSIKKQPSNPSPASVVFKRASSRLTRRAARAARGNSNAEQLVEAYMRMRGCDRRTAILSLGFWFLLPRGP